MYRFLSDRQKSDRQKSQQRPSVETTGHNGSEGAEAYAQFQGKIISVDLATVDGQTEDFEGRSWLESRVRDQLPVGWDLEWQPDRIKGSDNPIALMQFADENMALLLRTHKTRNWLPASVLRALLSDSCSKIGVGWDGLDKQKMQSTFHFQPNGIIDLASIAKKKGLAEQGLKSLTEHFGIKMRKDPRVARSNWAAHELTLEQIQYAADDAYFSYKLLDHLRALPDVMRKDPLGYAAVNQGVLEIQPGWEEQGIERRHDGLWCGMCEKGPMTVPLVVARHMEGKQHKKNLEARLGGDGNGPVGDLPEEYTMQGIVAGDGLNGIQRGEYKCVICDAGPFNALVTADAHIQSKKHQKNIAPPVEPAPSVDAAKTDPFEDHLWNLPDYVTLEGGMLTCTICPSKAGAVLPMRMHLGGNAHAKKCRSMQLDEILYVKERGRLELFRNGKPVVRSGYKAPKHGSKTVAGTVEQGRSQTTAPEPARVATPSQWGSDAIGDGGIHDVGFAGDVAATAAASDDGILPSGWEELVDTQTGASYFYNAAMEISQWERPQQPPRQSLQRLPPGWQMAWDEDGKQYYADLESQTSQWDAPPHYVHGNWTRQVDATGQAFWTCSRPSLSFYETLDNSWQRLVDSDHQIYWSNAQLGIRFFEDAAA
jgi:hypothetical protein